MAALLMLAAVPVVALATAGRPGRLAAFVLPASAVAALAIWLALKL